MNASTKYIEVNKGYAVVRLDNVGDETLITVYNVNIKDIDVLIEKLQGVKADFAPKPNIIPDEPPQMTAVLGKKPESTDWYKNALAKVAAQPEPYKYVPPYTVYEPDPEMPKPNVRGNVINIIGVTSKQHKNYGGIKNPDMNADILKANTPSQSYIRIYGLSDKRHKFDKETGKNIYYKVAYDRTFKMGDVVEYGSYNFAYTGKIIAIGEKTVKIEHSHGGKVTQLSLHDFINRNWDLDLAKIAEDRANWYD